MRIPRRIHFTWKTEDVPGEMGRYLKLWRALHPGWEINLWTDATMRDFVAATYPGYLGFYDAYPRMIQRADSFRYLVLNALGGVYADLDVEPFRSIDDLVSDHVCFAGIEPDEHMGTDRRHSGSPFLVTNAFMGGVAGHPWFRQLVELLPQTAAIPDIFLSTGPNLTTAAALRLTRADRPVLVLPEQWSPECDGGQRCRSDAKLRGLLGDAFDFVAVDGRFVAHRWVTSWVPWHKRYKWLAKPFHAMNAAKWAFRRWRYPELEKVDVRDPLTCYFDQFPRPPAIWPRVAVCVVAEAKPELPEALVSALSGLDYPAESLSFLVSLFGHAGEKHETLLDGVTAQLSGWRSNPDALVRMPPERAEAGAGLSEEHWHMVRWAMLANGGAFADGMMAADFVLFVDSGVTEIPEKALKAMLGSQAPIVALGARDADGRETDLSVFRYHWGGGIRVVYKIRGEDGLADPAEGQRDFLPELRAFAQIPLDGAGHSCVLVRREVLKAGVRFGEHPYHLHLGGEALALMARHKGYETAGLTEYRVTK